MSWRVSSKKTVGYVLSESNQLRQKLDYIIILDALSLKVTTSNLLEPSVSLMLTHENERKNHCSWMNYFIVLTIINPQTTVKPKIIQTPDIIFDILLLVGAGHYSSFM